MLYSLLPFLMLQTAQADTGTHERAQEIVEVRAAPVQARSASISGLSTLEGEDIGRESPTHANELFDRVPAVWISRGSGQEQLVAIRSPVLTGPGACGAFMVLEDHVPIRPTGFCNVNELFEVNLLQADRVDVIRGPGSVIYGSNALHGVVDVTSGTPLRDRGFGGGIEIGTDDYYRGRLTASSEALSFRANYTNSGSFRTDEGYEQSFANVAWDARALGADVATRLAYADIDQDTAGFVQGQNAYRDPVLRRSNPNPEAFRKATAWRVSSRWVWTPSSSSRYELTPYARHSDMDFLQHFLPGKPLETNGQTSAGLLFGWRSDRGLAAGIDAEWAKGDLVEFQEHPTEGSTFLMETRPQGFHYDYTVRSLMLAAWVKYEIDLTNKHKVTAGLRGELLSYDYDNHMLAGNTRDDGTPCGFGGCLYTRPANRSDRFDNLAPELGFTWRMDERTRLHARVARGYRAPQATELYRLQQGQSVADLETETLDTLEIGVHSGSDTLTWDATAYVMRKRHFIFRDANGFNVSDGRTDHLGAEAELDWQFSEHWQLSGNLAWARHEYAFNRPASGIAKGNEVDTAPAWLAGARLAWEARDDTTLELEWAHTGEYQLDPANEHQYEGHELFNVRALYRQSESRQQLALRVTNLLDTRYAERADYAFGDYRYFPGAGRRFFIEWRYLP